MMTNIDHSSAERWSIESIYQELLRRICTLEYPFKRRLGEIELAKEFGVSRTPVREVLQRLQADGLIDIRHGVGSIVIAGDPSTLYDIYSLRLEIAELIAKLSPRPIEPTMIKAIEELRASVRSAEAGSHPQIYFDVNARLHRVINSLIGNEELAKLHDLYYLKVSPFWYGLAVHDLEHELRALESELTESLTALRSGDIRAVASTHRNYTSYGMQRVRSRLAVSDESAASAG